MKMPVLVPFVNNTVYVAERGMTGITGNIYCGLHEFYDMAFCLHLLREDDTFIDVGANVGSYTLLASGVVGCNSISIEPVLSTFERLTRNIICNGLSSRVSALRVVAGREKGVAEFSTDSDTTNKIVGSEYCGSREKISVITLDEVLQSFGSGTLWKIDVEGFEFDVLKGARASLSDESLKAVLLEGDSQDIDTVMLSNGFSRAVYDPFSRTVEPVQGSNLCSAGRTNNLWVRDYKMVGDRCKTAPKYSVHRVEF